MKFTFPLSKQMDPHVVDKDLPMIFDTVGHYPRVESPHTSHFRRTDSELLSRPLVVEAHERNDISLAHHSLLDMSFEEVAK